MRISNLGIPYQEYEGLHHTKTLSPDSEKIIKDYIASKKFEKIVLFGASMTGETVKKIIKDKFYKFIESDDLTEKPPLECDAVFITAAPIHYDAIQKKLEENYKSDIEIITLFGPDQDIPIKLIIESQLRSGTHYTIENILKCLKWGYASVFDDKGSMVSRDKLICYEPGEFEGYIVKAHFTKTLHYPQYRYCKTMFLFSYFFDAYYSWAKLTTEQKEKENYRLVQDSKDWQILKSYIPQHKLWLDYISNLFFVRYEDYYLDFNKTIQSISEYINEDLSAFEKPRPNAKRTYFSGNYEERLDKAVCATIKKEFYPYLEKYYPEKIESI